MEERISFQELDPSLLNGMNQSEVYIRKSGFDLKLMELIKYRVAQLNGCAFCLDMHHKEAIHSGETELRLHSLSAWRDCPYYSDKERAALAYAEVLTNIADQEVSEEIYEQLASFYTKHEIALLTLIVTQINSWTRMTKAFRITPGNYAVGQFG